MTKPDIFDLYTDYLITSFSYTTTTGLSELVDGAVSHDQITRFLSHAKTVRTQSNHIFMSLYATARLEGLSMKQGLNKFAMKTRLYTKALRQAFKELKVLRASTA